MLFGKYSLHNWNLDTIFIHVYSALQKDSYAHSHGIGSGYIKKLVRTIAKNNSD